MSALTCYHCGDAVIGKPIIAKNHDFCCDGCKNVYLLLEGNDLGTFYQLEKQPGQKPSTARNDKYAFLDIQEIKQRYIQFEQDTTIRLTLTLPSIHCTSCIYLLENAHKLHEGIKNCQVHFAKKEATVMINTSEIKLSELALLLDRIGYPPNFEKKRETRQLLDKKFLLKLGIAGFSFGSIMLWSAPEYLGIENENPTFRNFQAYLIFVASLPVLIYSANEYFISAFKAIRHKYLNLDVPITIGILALYLQSSYTIFTHQGPGYMDSFAGFIFFLLIGKWFQGMSYRSLSFDRDYTAYFPVASTRIVNNLEEIVPIEKLVEGDVISVRNEEIIPCDAVLMDESCEIDYSFVTGESEPVKMMQGSKVYAGGKLHGNRVKLKVQSSTNRSHLTALWNETLDKKETNTLIRYQDKIAHYFLIGLLLVAGGAAIGWAFVDPSKIVSVVVAVLIVACPCALALSAPFTLGNIMRVFGKNAFFLKNTSVIEAMGTITDIVFDKTGTLTDPHRYAIEERNDLCDKADQIVLSEMTKGSTHPLSMALNRQYRLDETLQLSDFEEIKGEGIRATFQGKEYRLGNRVFCGQTNLEERFSVVFTKDGDLVQAFSFLAHFRPHLNKLVQSLQDYQLHVLSGDSDREHIRLEEMGFLPEHIHFHQKPKDKFDYIQKLNASGKKVMMIGDGLNDTGAIGAAQVGIAISEDMFRFTPSSDAILDAEQLTLLPKFLKAVGFSKKVLYACLGFSLTYNTVGLSIAISGALTPFIAAILMPLSSISVVLLSTLLVQMRYSKGVR
jgi:P-type Cu+ transporter